MTSTSTASSADGLTAVGPRATRRSPRADAADGTPAERPERRRRRSGEGVLVRYAFIAPAVLYLLLFYGYPIVKNVVMSFQAYDFSTFFNGSAPFVGLDNYATALSNPIFLKALANTGLFTVGSIIGQFVIGLGLSLYFRKHFPLSGVLRSLLLLPWLLPMIVSAAVWRWILEQDSGVLNRFLETIGLISEPIGWLTSTDTALIAVIMVNIWLGSPSTWRCCTAGCRRSRRSSTRRASSTARPAGRPSATSRCRCCGPWSAWCCCWGSSTRSRCWT
jgi:multiple sugar transport system permease protein